MRNPFTLRRTVRQGAASLVALAVGLQAVSAATTLFEQNFQDEVDAGRTTLTASGWSHVTADWLDAYNTTSYPVATVTVGGNNNYGAMTGPAHSVSGVEFDTPGASYLISGVVSTNQSVGFNSSNRTLLGLSLTVNDGNGIHAYLGGGGNTLAIAIGDPNTGNFNIFSQITLSTATVADSFYTLSLGLTSTTATAYLYDDLNTLIGSTSYTLASPLSGNPYKAIRLGQRDGSASALDFYSEVSVVAVPEPTVGMLAGAALVAGTLLRRRRTTRGALPSCHCR